MSSSHWHSSLFQPRSDFSAIWIPGNFDSSDSWTGPASKAVNSTKPHLPQSKNYVWLRAMVLAQRTELGFPGGFLCQRFFLELWCFASVNWPHSQKQSFWCPVPEVDRLVLSVCSWPADDWDLSVVYILFNRNFSRRMNSGQTRFSSASCTIVFSQKTKVRRLRTIDVVSETVFFRAYFKPWVVFQPFNNHCERKP